MQAVLALAGGRLQTTQRPIPSPGKGEVLIKVHCSPVNPADRMQVAGVYIQNREPPFTPGLVGVGTVVDARKGGLMGRLVAGKRVVFAPGPRLEGTWAQYALAPARLCLPLAADLSDTDGVNLLANATTVIGLLDVARQAKARAVVMTGAAGEIGRLLNVAARDRGVAVINVVRRADQAQLLRADGAEHVLDSQANDFGPKLAELATKLGATVAFDAVAGELTRDLLKSLPDGSEIVVLGRLSGDEMRFDGLDYLVGRHMKLSGFDVNLWVGRQSILQIMSVAKKAAALLRRGRGTRVQHRVSLSDLAVRFEKLQQSQTGGKTVVFPNGVPLQATGGARR